VQIIRESAARHLAEDQPSWVESIEVDYRFFGLVHEPTKAQL
jgi:hypothetical protein